MKKYLKHFLWADLVFSPNEAGDLMWKLTDFGEVE